MLKYIKNTLSYDQATDSYKDTEYHIQKATSYHYIDTLRL